MNWSSWKSYFETNGSRPLPKVSATGAPTDEEIRGSLARTFSVFQLGEAGEGRIAREVKSFESESIDEDWRSSLAMWVREEGRHGRVLGDCARALGGKPLYENWTNRLLIFGRRLLGLRLKLLVILCAEVIGITFYGLIARALSSSDIAAALTFISREEIHHLRFHARFFHLQTRSRWRRGLFLVAWWSVGTLAGLTVLVDHRKTLRLLEIPKAKVARAFVDLLLETSRAIAMGRDPEAPETAPSHTIGRRLGDGMMPTILHRNATGSSTEVKDHGLSVRYR